MILALSTALLFTGSRDSWVSFGLGAAAVLAFVLILSRVRRKEDR